MTTGASAAHSSLTLATCLLCIAATILHIIAFATPNWLVSDGSSPFVQLGFHEACFSNCFFPYCPGDPDIIYDRCYQWTFNEIIFANDQFRDIVNWLMPGKNLCPCSHQVVERQSIVNWFMPGEQTEHNIVSWSGYVK